MDIDPCRGQPAPTSIWTIIFQLGEANLSDSDIETLQLFADYLF